MAFAMKTATLARLLTLSLACSLLGARAQTTSTNSEVEQIRQEMQQLRRDYEHRMQSLEERLRRVETAATPAGTTSAPPVIVTSPLQPVSQVPAVEPSAGTNRSRPSGHDRTRTRVCPTTVPAGQRHAGSGHPRAREPATQDTGRRSAPKLHGDRRVRPRRLRARQRGRPASRLPGPGRAFQIPAGQ